MNPNHLSNKSIEKKASDISNRNNTLKMDSFKNVLDKITINDYNIRLSHSFSKEIPSKINSNSSPPVYLSYEKMKNTAMNIDFQQNINQEYKNDNKSNSLNGILIEFDDSNDKSGDKDDLSLDRNYEHFNDHFEIENNKEINQLGSQKYQDLQPNNQQNLLSTLLIHKNVDKNQSNVMIPEIDKKDTNCLFDKNECEILQECQVDNEFMSNKQIQVNNFHEQVDQNNIFDKNDDFCGIKNYEYPNTDAINNIHKFSKFEVNNNTNTFQHAEKPIRNEITENRTTFQTKKLYSVSKLHNNRTPGVDYKMISPDQIEFQIKRGLIINFNEPKKAGYHRIMNVVDTLLARLDIESNCENYIIDNTNKEIIVIVDKGNEDGEGNGVLSGHDSFSETHKFCYSAVKRSSMVKRSKNQNVYKPGLDINEKILDISMIVGQTGTNKVIKKHLYFIQMPNNLTANQDFCLHSELKRQNKYCFSCNWRKSEQKCEFCKTIFKGTRTREFNSIGNLSKNDNTRWQRFYSNKSIFEQVFNVYLSEG